MGYSWLGLQAGDLRITILQLQAYFIEAVGALNIIKSKILGVED